MTTIIILASFAVYSVVHSLLAGSRVKDWLRQRFGDRAIEGLYRLGYNIFATITLAPILLLVIARPGGIVWQAQNEILITLLAGIQIIGLIGLIIALLQIDLMRFAGLTQLAAYLEGKPLPLPPEPLQTSGFYAFVRHPLYLFSLMVIWPNATMSEALLAFNIAATAYFVVGSLVEERRMLTWFSEDYRRYQQRVPWLIPFLRLPRQRG